MNELQFCKDAVLKLHNLEKLGLFDSEDADVIRDQASLAWVKLSEAEKDEVARYSLDLG